MGYGSNEQFAKRWDEGHNLSINVGCAKCVGRETECSACKVLSRKYGEVLGDLANFDVKWRQVRKDDIVQHEVQR